MRSKIKAITLAAIAASLSGAPAAFAQAIADDAPISTAGADPVEQANNAVAAIPWFQKNCTQDANNHYTCVVSMPELKAKLAAKEAAAAATSSVVGCAPPEVHVFADADAIPALAKDAATIIGPAACFPTSACDANLGPKGQIALGALGNITSPKFGPNGVNFSAQYNPANYVQLSFSTSALNSGGASAVGPVSVSIAGQPIHEDDGSGVAAGVELTNSALARDAVKKGWADPGTSVTPFVYISKAATANDLVSVNADATFGQGGQDYDVEAVDAHKFNDKWSGFFASRLGS